MYQEIKKSRELKRLTQEEVATRLEISRQTYARIESGDSELTLWQAVILAKYLDITLWDMTWEDMRVISNQEYDIEQYKAILTQCIKFWSDKDGKITKTKLAKLAYLIDFGWFYENLELLTGLKGRTQLIENIGTPSIDGLSSEQLAFIEKICQKWQGKNTEDIVKYTHEQLPWKICYDGEIIPYELITQEDPDNVY